MSMEDYSCFVMTNSSGFPVKSGKIYDFIPWMSDILYAVNCLFLVMNCDP